MSWLKTSIVVTVLLLLAPSVLMTATADPVTIDRFSGDVESATLSFADSLINTSLSIDMPPGATITYAEMTLEGVGGAAADSSILNFTNGKLDSNVFANWTEGRDLYPPDVDPRNNQWTAINNREVPLLQKNDGQYWQLDTFDPSAGKPPGARPYHLFRFIPNSAGADNITVRWDGFSLCAMNRTNLFHAEMWMYDHTDSEWVLVGSYSDNNDTLDAWINYTFDLPSPYLDTDGSIDVLIVGINSEWAGPMLPAYDEGHLYTDYVEVEVLSKGGIQYPQDVSIYVDEEAVVDLTGEITSPVTVDDGHDLAAGLQAALDAHPVAPENVTLDLSFVVGAPTAGRLTVGGLFIQYDPIVNEAPTYSGPSTVTVREDGGRQVALDLDTAFDDDYNKGELSIALMSVDDSEFPNAIIAEVVAGQGGNVSLFVTPDVDFFGGPVNVTISALDAFMEEVSTTISVMVEQVGDPPTLSSGGTMEAFERSTFTHVFTVTDPDLPDDSFTFSDTSDMFDLDPLTGELNWTPASNEIGEHRFGVTVTDRFGLQDHQVYTIDVKNSNDPPEITSGLTLETVQGQETTYSIRAEDPDVPFGDVLSFFAFADDIEITVDQATGRITFTPGNAQVPQFEVLIRVQDAIGITDEETLVVTVANVNDPPVFFDHPDQTVDQGQEVTFQLDVNDPDMGVELATPETLTFTGTGPDWLMPSATGLVQFNADQSRVGSHSATYTVRDRAGLQDVLTIEWTVRDVNDAPVISTVLPDEIPEDGLFTITMEATDADGDGLTWSDDTGLFDIDPATGLIEFTPTQAQVGNLLITVSVEDGRGATTMLAWDFQVTNVNDDPVIDKAEPASKETVEEGEVLTFSAHATDEDGDYLTYTWKRGNKVLGTGANLKVDDLAPGEHTITLVVTDGNGGQATQDLKVEVTSAGMSTTTVMMALLVAILIAVVAAVLYWRSLPKGASAKGAHVSPDEEEEEEVVEKVSYEMAGVLEYDTEGIAVRTEGTTESVDEPIYSLEEAEEFHVPEGKEPEPPRE